MSFLAPLYALGALAVAAPIAFHLLRRRPRGEIPFASLMFLTPSPPRLTRRSRLDHLPLLVLRAAAIALLALAFARPFFPSAAPAGADGAGRRRVAVLVDASASMRRADLWARATAAARSAIGESIPGDRLALFAFDDSTRALLSFRESATLDPSQLRAVASARLAGLSPGWGPTNMGEALVEVASRLRDEVDATEPGGRGVRRIVLIGDFAAGASVDALGGFTWPSDVEVEAVPVVAGPSNAGIEWLDGAAEAGADGGDAGPIRVRVTNQAGSTRDRFEVARVDEAGRTVGAPTPAYVPAGESRVIRVDRVAGATPRALRLSGDDHPFDDVAYLASTARPEGVVDYYGPDRADDPAGLLFYLSRALGGSPGRPVRVAARAAGDAPAARSDASRPLAVVSGEPPPAIVPGLRAFAASGGTVLVVAPASGGEAGIGGLVGAGPTPVLGESTGGDALIGEVDFRHPLFAPMAGPGFNDFTKIHFSRRRRILADAIPGARVAARFEGGDPALAEVPVGRGRIVLMASGWAPADGGLGRSSKFVPLMTNLLDAAAPIDLASAQVRVGEPIPLPKDPPATTIGLPSGATAPVAPAQESFRETSRPGPYEVRSASGSRTVAVNLDPGESRTEPMPVETLARLGCRMAKSASATEDAPAAGRRLLAIEVEGRQKAWRPIVLIAVAALLAETALSAWLDRSETRRPEAQSP